MVCSAIQRASVCTSGADPEHDAVQEQQVQTSCRARCPAVAVLEPNGTLLIDRRSLREPELHHDLAVGPEQETAAQFPAVRRMELELADTIPPRSRRPQALDQLDVGRRRGGARLAHGRALDQVPRLQRLGFGRGPLRELFDALCEAAVDRALQLGHERVQVGLHHARGRGGRVGRQQRGPERAHDAAEETGKPDG